MMQPRVNHRSNYFTDQDWFDAGDGFDLDQDLLGESDFYSFEETDADFIQDQSPPRATNELVAQIYGQLLQHGTPTQRNPARTRAFVAHSVEPAGVQSEPTRGVRSLVDVSFIGRDGRRVNLEVDRTNRINQHAEDHRRAMQAAVRNRHSPASARSVFVGMDNRGRIQQIRHVHYERRGNRVVAVEDANVRLRTPITAQQAVRQGVLDDVQAARRVAAPQTPRVASRTSVTSGRRSSSPSRTASPPRAASPPRVRQRASSILSHQISSRRRNPV